MTDDLKHKTYDAVIKEVARRQLQLTISTESVDRDNDTIASRGWKLDAFRRNPVVLWAHDHRALPIARAVYVGVEGGALVATAEFPEASLYPFGAQVYDLVRGGYLGATSVGFRPLKYAQNTTRGGTDFLEQELLEFSICSVPANPEALARGVSDVAAVKSWLHGRKDADGAVFELADEDGIEADDELVAFARGLRAQRQQQTGGPLGPFSDPAASRVRRAEARAALLDVDPILLREVLNESLPTAIREEVKRATATALRQLRGRVD